MTNYFQFEADFVKSLRCIPMQARLKLDTCGLKLKLTDWHEFNFEEREKLVNMPCQSNIEIDNYRDYLQTLVINKTGFPAKELIIDENPAWLREDQIPDEVKNKATTLNMIIHLEQWQKLSPLERFALIKLSRSGHENNNFYPALKEFIKEINPN